MMLAAAFVILFVVIGNVAVALIVNTLTADGVITADEGRTWSLIALFSLIVAGYVAFWLTRRKVA